MDEPPAAPNRFQRRRLRNRAALLEAAIELFQREGVRATKLEDICERADVSARTFFNHFETREHLYEAIACQRAEQLASLLEARSDTRRPFSEQLSGLLQEIAAYLAARPAYRELVGEMLSLRAPGGSEAARPLRLAALRFVERGVARGEVTRRHRPEVLADLLLGAITTALGHWCSSDDYDLPRSLERSARALLDLLCERSPT